MLHSLHILAINAPFRYIASFGITSSFEASSKPITILPAIYTPPTGSSFQNGALLNANGIVTLTLSSLMIFVDWQPENAYLSMYSTDFKSITSSGCLQNVLRSHTVSIRVPSSSKDFPYSFISNISELIKYLLCDITYFTFGNISFGIEIYSISPPIIIVVTFGNDFSDFFPIAISSTSENSIFSTLSSISMSNTDKPLVLQLHMNLQPLFLSSFITFLLLSFLYL